ncbi:Peptidase inhibitor 15 [Apodemus speciosus]|uniref:Peptidase inhibitor 15 n=1 Tax=Apodemus speciosus TaxID=105296 RepID=A0ABQ0ECK0_APOSI
MGNWIGEAPYKVGVPCSSCPPSYGGACTDNLCFPGVTTNYLYWFK